MQNRKKGKGNKVVIFRVNFNQNARNEISMDQDVTRSMLKSGGSNLTQVVKATAISCTMFGTSTSRSSGPMTKWVLLMLHSENKVDTESQKEIARREKIGLVLLAFFSFIYFGFIALCAFANAWFANIAWLDVPATVWYGFGLIALALVIAGLYGRLSRTNS